MKHEEVARRYSRRPGFRLVSYRQVALPIFRVTLRVLIQERKPISPVQEFILRAIHEGVNTPQDIAGLLGLDEPIVRTALQTLLHSDDVLVGAPAPNVRTHQLLLTRKGEATLADAATYVPAEVQVWVDMDGLTHRLLFLGDRAIKPAQVKEEGLLEIPPYPRRKPRTEDIRLDDLHRALRERGVQWESRYVIAIMGVERVERLFRDDAIALVYKAVDGNEVQLGIVVDGRLSEEHEQALRKGDQARQLKLIPNQLSDFEQGLPQVIDKNLLQATVLPDATSRLRSELESASREVAELTQRLAETHSHSERAEIEQQLAQAENKRVQLEAAYAAMPARQVEVYEHPRYLQEALETAVQRVVIVSPWIRAKVVNDNFLTLLRKTLDRNVEVFIGYGISGEDSRESHRDREAVTRLQELSRSDPRFRLVYFGDTHAKVLICDRRFAIATSFNWLSFAGDPNLDFRDERGIYVAIPEIVDQFLNSYLPRFGVDVAEGG